jgi:hypothetical protein
MVRTTLLLLLMVAPANSCETIKAKQEREEEERSKSESPCLENYRDFTPSGSSNSLDCSHARHRIETENIQEGSYVRRVKVICRCIPESEMF